MRITGLTAPEYSILLWTSIILLAVIVTLVIRAVQARRHPVAEKQQISAAAYQRLAQLDDLRKRGALTEEEFAEKKQQIMGDL